MLFHEEFVETKLATKYADFNIRVYLDERGKENVVLWTKRLNKKKPVLVRVHSECLTGDLLGSLHCDCGQQLAKSLHLISEEGGVLIYLRQEGRGIGLFEKIKSYKLQAKGYDTFEANVLLGHGPDQRSYELVKTILADLGIRSIKLLTNNPSKVSELANLGIDIVERIPLISKPNKFNKNYLETKRKKFQHFLAKSSQSYSFQFYIDDPKKITSILKFLKQTKKDPLLRIRSGINANHNSLVNNTEITKIKEIILACKDQSEITPVIHFSFLKSTDPLKDILEIKNAWPQIKHIQLNDLEDFTVEFLEKISELFSIDIPLSDATFHFIHKSQFRNFITKSGASIVLDNSKGRGIKEKKESFIQKIDTLLEYGINNITLCGGFGPDQLNTYFEIKRYYKINFSIDSESNIKTNGSADIEKIKIYLFQLMRSDTPHKKGIEQTRNFLASISRTQWDTAKINGYEFSIHAKVFHAGYFPSTTWFATEICKLIKNESNFCEVGCGAGVISCLAALTNPKLKVVATDISPYATANTYQNAQKLGISARVTAFTGDVLDSLQQSDKFDSIFWALPFGYLDPGTAISEEEVQVFDPGYKAIRKFLQTAKIHLKHNGRLLLGFSSDLGHFELLKTLAQEVGASMKTLATTQIKEAEFLNFEILELRYMEKQDKKNKSRQRRG